MKDQTAASGTVWRPGSVSERKRDHRHKKKGCRSAPEDPQNVSLHFRKRNEGHRTTWRGIVRFDAVTTDVAGRDLSPEHYEAELRAVDASGDPVETHGQEVSTHTDGADFTVLAGSAVVVGKARRLEAVNAKIGTTLTGLTTGIDVGVDCYARKDSGAADSRVHFAVWDTVLGTEVAQKNGDPDSIKPKLVATVSFTPVAGHGYELRATFQSGSTGKPIIQAVQWHDKGDAAIWRHRVPGDADPLRASFPDLAKPKVWYYQARCRALNRLHGARCWSAWSAWTEATNPVTGDPIGPPAPDGITLTFHRDEARKKSPFQAKAEWNELPWWMPPDGEPVEGADRYAVRLAISDNGGSTTIRTRRVSLQAKDDDADQTAFYEFNNIRRRRHYRVSVRAVKDDRRGAWSAWSSWKSPKADIGNGPNNPLNVTKTKVKPGVILATWDEPTNAEDVDYYRVRVYCQGSLRETRKTRSEHYKYIVPDADRGTAHSFRVTAVDEDGNQSAEMDSGSETDTPDPVTAAEGYEVGDIRKLSGPIAGWLSRHPKWLRCNGNFYTVSSYPELFAEIGYTYGGSGSTFAVPDKRGKKATGVDDSGTASTLGETGGTKDHRHNDAGQHSHQTGSLETLQPAFNTYQWQYTTMGAQGTRVGGEHRHGISGTTGEVGSSHQHTGDNERYIAVHYVIKAMS